jgi:UDP-glucose 4-epimerase
MKILVAGGAGYIGGGEAATDKKLNFKMGARSEGDPAVLVASSKLAA